MCAAAVNIERKCPVISSKNLFFKSLTRVKLFDDVADFQHATQGLACSNKHGCILAAFRNSFIIFRAEDLRSAHLQAESSNSKTIELSQIPHVNVQNGSLGSAPSIVAVSSDEEYVAIDTLRNGHSFVIVFKLSTFLHQKGNCRPFCEIRGSTKPDAKIVNICWNPGESLQNMVAISSSDGSLILAKIVRENTIENWVINEGVLTICWSPKGKQLVVGKTDGNINQLKLDLTEAKKIPGPGGCIPTSIYWSSTTQFVVVFDSSSEISVMVVDIIKGAPVHYTNYDDVFMSDTVTYQTRCFFIPLTDWRCLISTTNSSSDVLLLGKESEGDPWSVLDVPDNKRASLPVDNYSLGAAVYFGQNHNVVISDSEQYGPMPVLYLLSQTGSLFSFLLINSDPGAKSLVSAVVDPIPESIFSTQNPPATASPSIPPPTVSFQSPSTAPLPTFSASAFSMPVVPSPAPLQTQPISFAPKLTPQPQKPLIPPSTSTAQGLQSNAVSPQVTQIKPLPQQGLPTAKELEQVKSILTERLIETNTLSDEAQEYQNLLIDVQKFEQRLSNFKQMQVAELASIEEKLEESCNFFDANIIGNMKTAENFVKDVEETTAGQKEEVEILKEKILYQLSNLEYAKSVLKQSEDLRCMRLLRSQALDPITLSKFQKIEKLHLYVRNQVTEAQRFFYYNKPEISIPKRQEPSAAQFIYQTLANHSQILRRLTQEVEKIRSALKLKKESSQVPKDWYKMASDLRAVEDTNLNTSAVESNTSPKSNTKLDSICLEDLMSGIRSVKLNSDSGDESNKPVVFTQEKLASLLSLLEEPIEINCEYDEAEINSKSVFNLGSLYNEVEDIKKTKETKIEMDSGGDNKFSMGDIPDQKQSPSQPFRNLSQLSANQRSVSFSLPSDQQQQQQLPSSSFFSMSSKIDTLQGGDNKLTGTVHPLPNSSDTVFNSSTAIKLKPFGSIAETTPLGASTNITITPMKFSAFAPADSVTPLSSKDKPLLFNPETSLLTGLSKSSELTVTATDSKNTAPKPSSSLFGIPSSSASLTITSGFTSGSQASLSSTSSFFGGASIFAQSGTKSPASTDTAPTSTSPYGMLGGVPPSVTVKSIATLPKASSSSSSSTSEESNAEQKAPPPTAQPLTILSTPTPKPNVGLWGVSTGTFSVQSQDQAPNTSTSATLNVSSLLSSTPVASTTIAGGSAKEVSQLLSMPKPVGTNQNFTVVTPSPLSTTQSSSTLFKSESSSSPATLKETPPPESTAAPVVPVTKSIFGGISSPISTAAASIAPTATTAAAAAPVPATSFLSSPATTTTLASSTSLFGNPPASLASTGLFGSSGLFSTPATTSSTTAPTTTSIFGSSLTSPTTTTGTTPSFSTSGLFASSSPTKSIFGGGSTLITSTVATAATTPTTSTSHFSSTGPQTTSTGLFSNLSTTTLTPTSSVAPLAAAATTSAASVGLFSSAPSSTSIFGGSSFGSSPAAAPVTTAASIFGSPAASIFGSPFGGNTTATPASPFGGNTTTTPASPFGDQTSQNVQSPFGGTTSSNTQSPFGGSTTVPPNQSPFATSNTTSSTSVFGGVGSSLFGGTSAIAPASPFGASSNISTTPASPFGAASTTSATSPSIFGQSQQTSVFGGAPTSTAFGGSAAFGSPTPQQNTSIFGQSTSASVFGGKPAFGGSAPFGSQSAFGSPSAASPTSSIFGTSSFGNTSTQPESIFGGSSFGLGAKPPADGANRNVFGGSTTYGSTPTPGIFGGTSSGIASSGSAVSGAFSAGGAGVAQTGFGAAAVKPAVAGFGGSATFGSAPAFGLTPFGPAFGSTASPTAAFGGASPGTGSIFGGGTQQSGPTFGALAQSTNQSTFGGGFSSPAPNASPFAQQQQSPSFGGGTSFSSWR